MAINYVAPAAPVQNISRSYSGGGGGGVSPQAYAAQQGAQLDYMRLLQNAAGMGATGRDVFQADAHMAAIQQQAEMQNWLSQQQMTQQEQQELTRSRAGLAEVDQLLAKGEINDSDANWYRAKLRGRIDFLGMKDQHTRTQAQAEKMNQDAMLFKAQKEKIDIMNSLMSGEVENQIDQYVLPEHKQAMADHMKQMFPELTPGSEEYKGRMKLEASQMGASIDMVKVPGKGLVPLSTLKAMMGGSVGEAGTGSASGGAAKPQSAGQEIAGYDKMFDSAYAMAQKSLSKKNAMGEIVPGNPLEIKALAEQMLRDKLAFRQQRQQEKDPKIAYQSAVGGVTSKLASIQGNPNLGEGAKKFLGDALAEVKALTEKYPPGGKLKMPQSVEQKIAKLLDQVDQYDTRASAAVATQPGG